LALPGRFADLRWLRRYDHDEGLDDRQRVGPTVRAPLGAAKASLDPIRRAESFGLVMTEAVTPGPPANR
jgi:hypothetical protein